MEIGGSFFWADGAGMCGVAAAASLRFPLGVWPIKPRGCSLRGVSGLLARGVTWCWTVNALAGPPLPPATPPPPGRQDAAPPWGALVFRCVVAAPGVLPADTPAWRAGALLLGPRRSWSFARAHGRRLAGALGDRAARERAELREESFGAGAGWEQGAL